LPAAGRLDQCQPAAAHRLSQPWPADERDIMPRQRQPRADERPHRPRTDDQYAQDSLESANGESANGESANGESANGESANGESANGESANGESAN
jgi:hypothetical protein